MGVRASHFTKHWQIARNERQLVLRRLNERQAKAFTFATSQKAGRCVVHLFKVFVADAFQPKQVLSGLWVMAKLLLH